MWCLNILLQSRVGSMFSWQKLGHKSKWGILIEHLLLTWLLIFKARVFKKILINNLASLLKGCEIICSKFFFCWRSPMLWMPNMLAFRVSFFTIYVITSLGWNVGAWGRWAFLVVKDIHICERKIERESMMLDGSGWAILKANLHAIKCLKLLFILVMGLILV